MGREWYWSRSTKRVDRESPGCISAVLQFFDFHHFPCTLQPPSFKADSFLQEDLTILKGVEAPRNSLESEEESFMGSASFSSIMKEEDSDIPIGIQLGTKQVTVRGRAAAKARMEELSSESSSSPWTTKSPNLVARLMGLDILPDNFSPCSSFSSSTHIVRSNSLGRPYHHQLLQERNACAAVKRDIRSRRPLQSRTNFIDSEVAGTRSLPDTPRISSARRSDVEHRLSLQINKENLLPTEDFGYIGRVSRDSVPCSPYSTKSKRKEWRHDDENRSPRHYARQIVKQVKERVGRKIGLDIINTTSTRTRANEGENALTTKSKKTRRLTKQADESSPSKHSTPTCSPRLRFMETTKSAGMITSSPTHEHQTSHSPRPYRPSSPPSPCPPPLQSTVQSSSLSSSASVCADNQLQSPKAANAAAAASKPKPKPLPLRQQTANKCKKGSSTERFTQRLKKPPQATETIRNVREGALTREPPNKANVSEKKNNKTPLSNDFVNITVPSFVPFNKEQQPQQPSSQAPVVHRIAQDSKRCSQLSSGSSLTYESHRQEQSLVHQDDNNNNNDSSNGGDAEFEYVFKILKRTGIDRDTLVSFTRWFSPSHPLDPSIFHHLEQSYLQDKENPNNFLLLLHLGGESGGGGGSPLKHRWNRKLLFHLVDEILGDVLRPLLNTKPWLSCICIDNGGDCTSPYSVMTGSQLLDRLWTQIRSYPCANCQVLQDIDALIDKDLPHTNVRTVLPFSEEGESIVFEIERDILDSLVHETAAVSFALF
ncbi:PREDICTED: uncharacterized protein LOC104596220 [Nelumbo nucifera]|uniref:Uncharacterized protein LOC104596220 n=2 Tax=Nelumbo nucifera TaxID=4432 RepID=A0A1U7ZN94_NELNU|nr:PREDICTED: uncharacterized protein LOC104596220 [Nelumbo nucifera]DAD18728.1 TPA_asm: hypothetical protein HUJ06_020191 [Nelumbo nucifera]